MPAAPSRHPKPEDWRSPHGGSYCGAWAATRKRACRMWPVPGKTRCRHHGGKSTGPRTETGRQAISELRKAEWREWRQRAGLKPDWRYDDSRRRGGRQTAAQWLAEHKPEPAT